MPIRGWMRGGISTDDLVDLILDGCIIDMTRRKS